MRPRTLAFAVAPGFTVTDATRNIWKAGAARKSSAGHPARPGHQPRRGGEADPLAGDRRTCRLNRFGYATSMAPAMFASLIALALAAQQRHIPLGKDSSPDRAPKAPIEESGPQWARACKDWTIGKRPPRRSDFTANTYLVGTWRNFSNP